MKKSDILKAFLVLADDIGEVTGVSVHDTWVSVRIKKDEDTECLLDFNILKKEVKTDGN